MNLGFCVPQKAVDIHKKGPVFLIHTPNADQYFVTNRAAAKRVRKKEFTASFRRVRDNMAAETLGITKGGVSSTVTEKVSIHLVW